MQITYLSYIFMASAISGAKVSTVTGSFYDFDGVKERQKMGCLPAFSGSSMRN